MQSTIALLPAAVNSPRTAPQRGRSEPPWRRGPTLIQEFRARNPARQSPHGAALQTLWRPRRVRLLRSAPHHLNVTPKHRPARNRVERSKPTACQLLGGAGRPKETATVGILSATTNLQLATRGQPRKITGVTASTSAITETDKLISQGWLCRRKTRQCTYH